MFQIPLKHDVNMAILLLAGTMGQVLGELLARSMMIKLLVSIALNQLVTMVFYKMTNRVG